MLELAFLENSEKFNPHLPSGPVHPYQLDESVSNFGVSGALFHYFLLFQIDIPVSKQ